MSRSAYDYVVSIDAPAPETLCDGCGCEPHRFDELEDIEDCSLTPGDGSPAGRCPECQGLVYPREKPLTVYTLTIDHKHGVNSYVHKSEEGALRTLAEWAREWWRVEFGWSGSAMTREEFAALPDGEAVRVYFEAMEGRESYSLDSTTLDD